MPADLQPGRLEKDVALMKSAGITVVRMGESTWSLWEPADGRFEYEWMDRVVNAMGKAGIKVIMGTPTYSIPTWMAKAHPEIIARPLGGGYVGYGMRQNMDYDNPQFRFYAERCITNLVGHYKDNPAVIMLDLKLPKVNGLEVLQQIRSDDRLKMVTVVVLTSSQEEKDMVKSYALGVNAYVVKPVDFHEFINAVKELGVFWAIINQPPPGSVRK